MLMLQCNTPANTIYACVMLLVCFLFLIMLCYTNKPANVLKVAGWLFIILNLTYWLWIL